MHTKRQFGQNVVLSLSGSILPAVVGVVGTVLLVRTAPESASVTILTAWTLLGYMVLSDLGLTRSSSKLLSSGVDAATAVGTLWRTALPLGVVLAFVTGAMALLVSPYLALLIPVPILTTLQFPIAGALEATGQFAVLAGQRLVNAVSVYFLPPLAVAVLGVEQGLIVGFSIVLVARAGCSGTCCPTCPDRFAAPSARCSTARSHLKRTLSSGLACRPSSARPSSMQIASRSASATSRTSSGSTTPRCQSSC